MFKFVGALIIFVSSTLWGLEKALIPLKRYKNLTKIIAFLNAAENEIRFTSDFIDDIFLKVSKIIDFDYIFKTTASCDKSLSLCERWKKAVFEDSPALFLTKEDSEVLIMLGAELGMTDRDGQIKNIENTLCTLEAFRQEAKENYEKTAKLKRGLGISVGLAAIILLY